MGIEKTIKVAIIGAGYMAHEHIKAFNQLQGVHVTGIYSRTIEKASAFANELNIPYVCNSIAQLYEITKADIVIVAVNELSLPLIIDDIFEYPWLSLIEKPIGINLEVSLAIQKKTRSRAAQVLVGLNRRFYNATQSVLSHLKEEGGKRFIQVKDYQSLEQAKSLYPATVTDNLMYANSIHLIDYFLTFGRGKITDVNVAREWDPVALTPVIAHIQFDSGDEGLYTGVWNKPGPWEVSVVTEKTYHEMKPLEQACYRTNHERKLIPHSFTLENYALKPGLLMQAEQAILFLKNKTNQSVTLTDSIKTMRLISKIYNQ